MNKLTLLLLLGTISQSDAILLNKKELVQAKAVVAEKASTQNKQWNILADVVNEKEYMKTQMSALEEQDMHNTDKYTMSAPEFFQKMEKEDPAPKARQ
jgi:G3E family GTPase